MLVKLGVVPIIFVFLTIGVLVLLLFQAFASPTDTYLLLFLWLWSLFGSTLVGLLINTESELIPIVSYILTTWRLLRVLFRWRVEFFNFNFRYYRIRRLLRQFFKYRLFFRLGFWNWLFCLFKFHLANVRSVTFIQGNTPRSSRTSWWGLCINLFPLLDWYIWNLLVLIIFWLDLAASFRLFLDTWFFLNYLSPSASLADWDWRNIFILILFIRERHFIIILWNFLRSWTMLWWLLIAFLGSLYTRSTMYTFTLPAATFSSLNNRFNLGNNRRVCSLKNTIRCFFNFLSAHFIGVHIIHSVCNYFIKTFHNVYLMHLTIEF